MKGAPPWRTSAFGPPAAIPDHQREEDIACCGIWPSAGGRTVVHLWDRGFAGAPWLGLVIFYQVRFIVRWNKDYKLIDPKGRLLKTWECSRGKRSLDHRMIHDARRRCERKTGIVFLPVRVPDFPDHSFTLVVSRPGKGRKPWYLLTNEIVTSVEDAWRIVLAYNRRWQVELSIRFSKSELAFESPRLLAWEHRAKLMALAALVQAFLFSLLNDLLLPLAYLAARSLVPPNGKAEPLYRSSALSLTSGFEPALARFPPFHPA